jgi:hypothetical protein
MLQSRALADSSHRKYKATWREWTAWCDAHHYQPWLTGDLAQASDQIVRFAIHCWRPRPHGRGNAASTVLSKLGHISWYHRRFCGFPVNLHAGHRLAMQGMLRLSPPPQRKRPVTVDHLRRIRTLCNLDSARGRVLWGAAVVGFFFLLRRSEYLADKGRVKAYALQYRDVTFSTSTGRLATTQAGAEAVTIHLRGGKADQRGIGATRTLERSGLRWLCPVRACWAIIDNAKRRLAATDEPLCSISTSELLSAADMTAAIKGAAQVAGENSSDYGTHSMRSGGATAMFAAGVDRLAIKHFGRWSSDSFEQYARINGTTIAGLAAKMAGGRSRTLHFKHQAWLRHTGGHSTPHPTAGVA